ncbi:F420-dependent methylenetetrahydromethanopterin dehydrogenase [Candidatus Bathyarchaeota archaeon]|nr:F420-dependent methylenetetrahydromethanopterin dehydrogenase [Candidatus Bathyarchaeota archaeon]MBS7631581.1 F420-dependent methylenetetrahydromethanopterin dehydrogenase [Candidatus Bathyarchaeota archaeon]
MVKITFLKIGFIGTTPLIDALLDERASRKDLSVRVVSSGCKMEEDEALDVSRIASSIESDLYIVISPNAGLPGPSAARRFLKETGKPIIVISDDPSRKIAKTLEEEGLGYLIICADPMIGARQDFLDPVEMAVFNSDVIRVLAVTGVFRLIHTEIDRVVEQIAKGGKPELPKIVIDKEAALSYSGINNPYAKSKALASFEMAKRVAALSTEGCYKVEERERYIPLVAAAHEMMRTASLMADEAREIEKYNDSVTRIVHFKSGYTKRKTRLMDRFE